MKINKTISLSILAAIIFLFAGVKISNAKALTYYSGDAAYYNGRVIVASADSGSLELFAEESGILTRLIKFQPTNNNGQAQEVSSVKLSVENNQLFAYTTAGYTVYKYDITDPSFPAINRSARNTYWEWYNRVDKTGDRVTTISNKKINILNSNLENLDYYSFDVLNAYDISFDDSGRYIFANDDNYIRIYDRIDRDLENKIALNYQDINIKGNHRVYYSPFNKNLFVNDDYAVKRFDLQGNLVASFKHLDKPGYDVVPDSAGQFVYVSNGAGVLKLNQSDLKLTTYKFTYNLGGSNGWAMGLKSVATEKGDRLIVFNAGNILVLDKNLNKIASYRSTGESQAETSETLFLNLDHNSGLVGAAVNLFGGGYFPKERLTISFGDLKTETTTDNQGRFKQILTVPDVKGGADIKVIGQNSKLSYSISFQVVR